MYRHTCADNDHPLVPEGSDSLAQAVVLVWILGPEKRDLDQGNVERVLGRIERWWLSALDSKATAFSEPQSHSPTWNPAQTPWSSPRLTPSDLMPADDSNSRMRLASAGSPLLGYSASYM